jgi:hypothetical protein
MQAHPREVMQAAEPTTYRRKLNVLLRADEVLQ